MDPSISPLPVREAACTCGELAITLCGEPASVYSCGCETCRRTTGSAFAWRARYDLDAIVAERGRASRWRRTGDSGRWVEHVFCPACGALLYQRAEALPAAIVVSAGCFLEPMPLPQAFHNFVQAARAQQ